ncbi:hypothetical protein HOLleu_26950 [Holothuria leucospilota]|uniref:MAPEG family protein n=1 Tax=Holothuria leucospilota TaxID=206669 RepID=A0A9Q1BPN3_HOLLE|nr:hypothetical protein HOLleu_26950 [Holothuria leucospilota]
MQTSTKVSDRGMASHAESKRSGRNTVLKAVIINWITFVISCYLTVNYQLIPTPKTPSLLNRIVFTTRMMVVTVLPLQFGVAVIMKTRADNYSTMGLSPANAKGNYVLNMANRYMQNTTEQLIMFIVLQLTLSTLLSPEYLPLIPTSIFLFVVSRFIFFAGYIDAKRPINRAYGFAMTLVLNISATIMCFFLMVTKGPTFDL